jgi:SPP1 gp7 family putative phage head morphogenesis protein
VWSSGPLTLDGYKALLLLDPDDDEAESKIRQALERRSAISLSAAFREMQETLYPRGMGEWLDPDIEGYRVHRRFVESQRLYAAVRQAIAEGADLGVNVAVTQLGNVDISFDWTLANVAAGEWAELHAGELITQIADTSRDNVRRVVGRWVGSGESLSELVQALEMVFGRQRAERIAATEVTQAYYRGNVEAWQASGVVQEIQWRTAVDELVCEICRPLNGERTRLGESFVSPETGIEHAPPAHVNCRCWAVPVIGG